VGATGKRGGVRQEAALHYEACIATDSVARKPVYQIGCFFNALEMSLKNGIYRLCARI